VRVPQGPLLAPRSNVEIAAEAHEEQISLVVEVVHVVAGEDPTITSPPEDPPRRLTMICTVSKQRISARGLTWADMENITDQDVEGSATVEKIMTKVRFMATEVQQRQAYKQTNMMPGFDHIIPEVIASSLRKRNLGHPLRTLRRMAKATIKWVYGTSQVMFTQIEWR